MQAFFGRLDPSPDTDFYADARVGEQHLDAAARAALTQHYARVFKVLAAQPPLKVAGATTKGDANADTATTNCSLDVLDLCSSFESHFPGARGDVADAVDTAAGAEQQTEELPAVHAYGVGLNVEELAANSRLSAGYEVVDLNATPKLLAHANNSYDLVTCALSVDYLTQPMEVSFRSINSTLFVLAVELSKTAPSTLF